MERLLFPLYILLLGVFGQSQANFNFTTGNQIFKFEEDTTCQTCLQFWDTSISDGSISSYNGGGYFQFSPDSLAELGADHEPCCSSGSSCYFDEGCNYHVFQQLGAPYFTATSNNSYIRYDGNMSAGYGQTQKCRVPTDGYSLCIPITYTNEFVYESRNVMIGNETFTLLNNSVYWNMRISNWTFASGSTGVRLNLTLGGVNLVINNFYYEPGDIKYDGTQSTNFTGVAVSDDRGMAGAFYFPHTAIVDGRPVKVNISGMYTTYLDPLARLMYIDFPVFNDYIEFSVNVFAPTASGINIANDDDNTSWWYRNGIYVIPVVAVVAGLCLCYVCFVALRKGHRRYKGRNR